VRAPAAVVLVALCLILLAPSSGAAASLDTVDVTGSSLSFQSIDIHAQSRPGGVNPSGTGTYFLFGTEPVIGPVTCSKVTGPGRGGGTAAAPTRAVLNIDSELGLVTVALTDNGGGGMDIFSSLGDRNDPSDCSPLTNPLAITERLTNGRATVFDAPPTAEFLSPLDGATNVPAGASVVAVFNEALDRNSLTGAFTLRRTGDGAPVAGSVYLFAERTPVFVPAVALAAGTQFTATISTAAKTAEGNTLPAPVTWRFTTSPVPVVRFVSPADGATGVPVGTVAFAAFNAAMDRASTAAAFSLRRTSDGAPIAGTVDFYGSAVPVFKPTQPLAGGTRYTATISTAAMNTSGHHLAAPKSWSFVTQ
jgi:hypothetical protein